MEAVNFPEMNTKYAKHQEEYKTLPAFKAQDEEGIVITCWKLTFWERVKLLWKAHLWLNMMTFNKPLTPVYMSVDKKDIFDNPL